MRSLLKSFVALVCLYSAVEALPQPGTATELTNGERMARGLRPLKPARLFNASAPIALRPRASSAPAGATPFKVAAGPANSQGSRKRDGGVPGYFSTDGTSLSFATSQASAATFYYTNPSIQDSLSVQTGGGAVSEVYAVLTGAVYVVKVGTPPAGSLTKILARGRYAGDLTPSVPPAGSTTRQDALWVRGSSGALFIALDTASAQAYDPSATVLLTQTFAPGQPPSLVEATAAQQGDLSNPVKYYIRDVRGRAKGYFWFVPSRPPMLVYQNSRSDGYTFYLPNFGSSSAPDQRTLTTLSGTTVVGTLASSSQGNYLKFVDASTATSPILSFNVPASGSGKVTLSSGGTTFNGLFYANGGDNSDTFRFLPCPSTDPSSCGSSLSLNPVCIEAVMGNVQPSVCLAEAKEAIARDYTGQSSIYLYDPAGVRTGYLSFSINTRENSLIANQDSTTYVYSKNPVSTRRMLYTITNRDTDPTINGFYASGNGNAGSSSVFASNDAGNTATFNIPSGGEMTLHEDTIPAGVTIQDWPFYYTENALVACASAEYCPADRGYSRVCAELVPAGGSPQTCKAGWQPSS